jgi:hypothetical protein
MPNDPSNAHARSDKKDTYADRNENTSSHAYADAYIRNAGYTNANLHTHRHPDEHEYVYPYAHGHQHIRLSHINANQYQHQHRSTRRKQFDSDFNLNFNANTNARWGRCLRANLNIDICCLWYPANRQYRVCSFRDADPGGNGRGPRSDPVRYYCPACDRWRDYAFAQVPVGKPELTGWIDYRRRDGLL